MLLLGCSLLDDLLHLLQLLGLQRLLQRLLLLLLLDLLCGQEALLQIGNNLSTSKLYSSFDFLVSCALDCFSLATRTDSTLAACDGCILVSGDD